MDLFPHYLLGGFSADCVTHAEVNQFTEYIDYAGLDARRIPGILLQARPRSTVNYTIQLGNNDNIPQ